MPTVSVSMDAPRGQMFPGLCYQSWKTTRDSKQHENENFECQDFFRPKIVLVTAL